MAAPGGGRGTPPVLPAAPGAGEGLELSPTAKEQPGAGAGLAASRRGPGLSVVLGGEAAATLCLASASRVGTQAVKALAVPSRRGLQPRSSCIQASVVERLGGLGGSPPWPWGPRTPCCPKAVPPCHWGPSCHVAAGSWAHGSPPQLSPGGAGANSKALRECFPRLGWSLPAGVEQAVTACTAVCACTRAPLLIQPVPIEDLLCARSCRDQGAAPRLSLLSGPFPSSGEDGGELSNTTLCVNV